MAALKCVGPIGLYSFAHLTCHLTPKKLSWDVLWPCEAGADGSRRAHVTDREHKSLTQSHTPWGPVKVLSWGACCGPVLQVLMAAGERAELASEEYVPLSPVSARVRDGQRSVPFAEPSRISSCTNGVLVPYCNALILLVPASDGMHLAQSSDAIQNVQPNTYTHTHTYTHVHAGVGRLGHLQEESCLHGRVNGCFWDLMSCQFCPQPSSKQQMYEEGGALHG
eukprot:839544-Pelagomonas_calceolata.AAC.1